MSQVMDIQNYHFRLRGNFTSEMFCTPIFSHVRWPVYAYHAWLATPVMSRALLYFIFYTHTSSTKIMTIHYISLPGSTS